MAVIGNTGLGSVFVGAEGGLPPPPGIFVVEGDAETDAGGARGLGPFAEEVALGAEAGGVPRLIRGVPQVEVIVVDTLDDQEAGAGVLVDLDEFGGVELGGIPIAQDFLVARLGGMAVIVEMVVIRGGAGLVEVPGIPVAALAGSLGAKVNPNAELRLAQPGRRARIVFLDGFPCRLKRAGRDGKVSLTSGADLESAIGTLSTGSGGGYGGKGRQRRQGGADGVSCGRDGCH